MTWSACAKGAAPVRTCSLGTAGCHCNIQEMLLDRAALLNRVVFCVQVSQIHLETQPHPEASGSTAASEAALSRHTLRALSGRACGGLSVSLSTAFLGSCAQASLGTCLLSWPHLQVAGESLPSYSREKQLGVPGGIVAGSHPSLCPSARRPWATWPQATPTQAPGLSRQGLPGLFLPQGPESQRGLLVWLTFRFLSLPTTPRHDSRSQPWLPSEAAVHTPGLWASRRRG